jgi:sugar lactone lactonase YvrE
MEMIRTLLSGESGKHPIPPMDGPWTPNDQLEELETQTLDASAAPDDVVSDGNGGLLVSNGSTLLRLSDGKCKEFANFDAPLSAITRLADGTLVIALDGEGLRHIDPQGHGLEVMENPVEVPSPGITAVAPAGHGGVYFTIGSTHHQAEDWVWDLMERNRSGLLGYWLPGQKPKILLHGLAWPNGMLVNDTESQLIITESWVHSITCFPIQGDGLGEPSPLVTNLPGYPSRISAAQRGGYWLAIFAMRTELVELLLRDKEFKPEMMRTLPPELWIRPALSSTGSLEEPLQAGGMRTLGISKPWAPPRSYGLVVRIDEDGEAVDSMHCRAGGFYHGVTAAREIDDRLYVVCKGAHSLLIAPLNENAENLS